MEPLEPDSGSAKVNELLIAPGSANIGVDEDQDGGDLGEPADELDLAENYEHVHLGGSPIDCGLDNDGNLLTHPMRDAESDKDISEKEYIPFTVWSLIRKASILQRREQNSVKIFELLDENEFFEFYAPVSEDLFCRSPEMKVWRSGIEARITHLGIVGHLSKYGFDGYVSISPICSTISDCCSLSLRILANSWSIYHGKSWTYMSLTTR
jgi:hypothetical protein